VGGVGLAEKPAGRAKEVDGTLSQRGRFASPADRWLPQRDGMGKTHGLLVAGKLLGAERSLYLTYNLDQDLSFDHANPRMAVLLRVLLRSIGIGNTRMSSRLSHHADILKTLDVEDLLECVAVHLAGTVASKTASDALDTTDIFIGLDEIRKLLDDASTNRRVLEVASTLGQLAHRLHEKGVSCTVVVSALTQSSFRTLFEREIYLLHQSPGDRKAIDVIMNQLLPDATPWQRAIVEACAGTWLFGKIQAS